MGSAEPSSLAESDASLVRVFQLAVGHGVHHGNVIIIEDSKKDEKTILRVVSPFPHAPKSILANPSFFETHNTVYSVEVYWG
jgi:hypothetical protein